MAGELPQPSPPRPLKRRARALARRAAVEVLARTDRPGRAAEPTGDIVLLLHHMPEPWLARMDAVVELMMGLARPASYTEICSVEADEPRFAVTFDDGNKSQVRAAERLAAAGISACFFIISDGLDADDAETARICRQHLWMEPTPFMSRDDLDAVVAMGHEIGSHTRGHINLADASDDQLADQVAGSREVLAPWLGATAHFAWPFGGADSFSRRAYDAVGRAGYATVATALRGMDAWRPVDGGPPVVFRQSVNLEDSLAVQRRFILGSEHHVQPSKQALAYLT